MRHFRSLPLVAVLALAGGCNAMDVTQPALPVEHSARFEVAPPPPPPPPDPTQGSGN